MRDFDGFVGLAHRADPARHGWPGPGHGADPPTADRPRSRQRFHGCEQVERLTSLGFQPQRSGVHAHRHVPFASRDVLNPDRSRVAAVGQHVVAGRIGNCLNDSPVPRPSVAVSLKKSQPSEGRLTL